MIINSEDFVQTDQQNTTNTLTARMNKQCIQKLSKMIQKLEFLRIGLCNGGLITAPQLSKVYCKKRHEFKYWNAEQMKNVFSDVSFPSVMGTSKKYSVGNQTSFRQQSRN
ncbi:hypothetical protein TNIN_384011 [Trichonephila inaurata madagascariensis]|uniref:Uncharacterized protein n=1 Tax=Trichonephila inaurata madagascariensis TaxID=2747483 RepID=A0A8X6XYD4_9ARAC|nr:hypothetical protein TNIN_384011 [Trichonephila inaurata madagascariensis]